jgi:alkylhydroperoxidase family enzyme
MTRVSNLVDAPTELDGVWGKRPEYYAIFMGDYNDSIARVDPELVELCRIRIAQLVESAFDLSVRYGPAQTAGLTEDKIAALSQYPDSELFTEKERAALEFTEQFVIQSSSISDEDVTRLQEHLTAEEFIYLTKSLGAMDQFARANSAFRIAPATAIPATMPAFTLKPAKS